MYPTWIMTGNRSFVTAMGKASISLAHTGRIPLRTVASGNPPIPLKRLPMVNSFVIWFGIHLPKYKKASRMADFVENMFWLMCGYLVKYMWFLRELGVVIKGYGAIATSNQRILICCATHSCRRLAPSFYRGWSFLPPVPMWKGGGECECCYIWRTVSVLHCASYFCQCDHFGHKKEVNRPKFPNRAVY